MTQKTIRKLLSRSEALSQLRGAFSDFHGKRGTLSRSDSLPPSAWFDLRGHVLEAVKWFSLPDALQICLTACSCVTQPLSPSCAAILCGICTLFCSLNLSGCETLNLERDADSAKTHQCSPTSFQHETCRGARGWDGAGTTQADREDEFQDSNGGVLYCIFEGPSLLFALTYSFPLCLALTPCST